MIVLFETMTDMNLYITITLFIIILFVSRINPVAASISVIYQVIFNRKYLFHVILVLSMLFINKMELNIEEKMVFQTDFTPYIYSIEGDFVAIIQKIFLNPLLTLLTSYFYLIVFPCLMIASILIYTYKKEYTLFYALCYAITINYLVAIPFYLFFPVNEVWFFHPHVDLLILDVFPSFEQEYRTLSGLNNCLPSLHTSLSISVTVLAMQSKFKIWRLFVICSMIVIIFSIFYLGIHWFIDMCSGVILGASSAYAGMRLTNFHFAPLINDNTIKS